VVSPFVATGLLRCGRRGSNRELKDRGRLGAVRPAIACT
jgi:hypothetical protein